MNDFQKMFYRIIKEYDIPNKKYIMRYFLTNEVTPYKVSRFSIPYLYANIIKDKKIVKHLNNVISLKKTNQIFLLYTIKHIIAFLKKYEIYKNFEQNISKGNYLKEYFEYLFNHGYSPFTFFSGAFTWAQTKEGHKFWENIHELFITVLAEELTKKIERHE